MRVCLMIEGQEDVSWAQWVRLAHTCEKFGYDALFRSDHYLSVMGATERGSLDAWATIAGLGALTGRIRLGTLVSPVTFRHPSVLAKMVVTADHISDGRVELGLGAGWYEAEHQAHGFEFFDTKTRMKILGEQLDIVHRHWQEARPPPVQKPHPPVIVGGSGKPKTLAFAARWADEYNTLFSSPEECKQRRALLDEACTKIDRDPATIRLSLMATCIVGRDEDSLLERAARVAERAFSNDTPEAYLERIRRDRIAGTPDEVVEKLGALSDAGVGRIMLQHLVHDDLDMVELIGTEVIPRVS